MKLVMKDVKTEPTQTFRDENYSVWDENTLNEINTRLDIAKENTGELDYIEMMQNETQQRI